MRQILLIFILLFSPFSSISQWLNTETMKSIVLLAKEENGSLIPHGTGFLVYNYKNSASPIIVTCAHLLSANKLSIVLNADSALLAKLQGKYPKAKYIGLDKSTWHIQNNLLVASLDFNNNALKVSRHKELDIAAFALDLSGNLPQDLLTIFNVRCIPASCFRPSKEILLGDEAYFVGFPMGLGISNSLNPIVRSGSIASICPDTKEFILDAISMGGNSGSPVFTKNIIRKPGDISWDGVYLIGMAFGHYGETFQGVIMQPNSNKEAFNRQDIHNNWGLARVVWGDEIKALCADIQKQQ